MHTYLLSSTQKIVFEQHAWLINIEFIDDCPLSYLDRLLRQQCKILQYQPTTFRSGKKINTNNS